MGRVRRGARAGPPLLLISLLAACGPGEQTPVDLVLITIDTLRADHLPAHGYPHVDTPAIDALVADGVLFERATAPTPLTLPSHTSILTGLEPVGHGVRANGSFRAPPELTTLAEVLAGQGYHTAAFVGSFALDSRFGLDQGFQVYDDDMLVGRPEGAIQERRGGTVVERAAAWVAGREQGPAFLWVHLFDPHAPYRPPPPWADEYAERPYDGEIAYTDAQVGRLIEHLRAGGLYDDALVVLTGDHGESLGEHGEATHSVFVYEATQWVPLVVKLPGSRGAGTRVGGLVRHVDLLPTVVEALGVGEVPPGVAGRSLLPLLDGEVPDEPVLAFAESHLPRVYYGWSALESIRDSRHKYVLAPRPELYDLVEDPDELHDLVDDDPQTAGRLRRTLEAYRHRWADPEAQERATVQPDLHTRLALEALGYLSVGAGGAGADPKDVIHLQGQIQSIYLLNDTGQHPRAFELARAVVDLDPDNPGAHLVLASSLEGLGRAAEAEAEYQEVLRLDPGQLGAHLGLIRLHLRPLRDLGAAERGLDRVEAMAPHEPMPLVLRAALHLERGEVESALGCLERARAMGAQSPQLFAVSGRTLYRAGRLDDAERELRIATQLDPDDPASLTHLGEVLLDQGRTDEAIEVLDRAVSAPVPPGLAHLHLGRARVRAGELDLAWEHLQVVGHLPRAHPARSAALLEMAGIRARQGSTDEARLLLHDALEHGGERLRLRAGSDPHLVDLLPP